MSDSTSAPDFEKPPLARQLGIGCFMAFVGFFSGGMIGVLVSKGVAFFSKAPTCDGIPTCDWYIYMFVGGALGALTLPWLVVSAMRSAPAPKVETSEPKD
jgi:hypothetical protein